MQGRETEVNREAQLLVEQHGRKAVYVALDQLNRSIDQADYAARDFWVRVVRAIHEYQRTGSC